MWRVKIVVKLRANRGKVARFNSINSEISGRNFTKFGHDVAWLLPLELLKTDLRLANRLSNAKAKSKGHSTLLQLYNFLCLKLWGHQITADPLWALPCHEHLLYFVALATAAY